MSPKAVSPCRRSLRRIWRHGMWCSSLAAFHPAASRAALLWVLALLLGWETLPAAGQVGQAGQAAHTLPKDSLKQMECPNKAIQPKCILQNAYRWSSLTMHWAIKLSFLSLVHWGDFAAALSSGAQSSRIAELILWNVKKQLHKIAFWSIWLLEHVENSKKYFLPKHAWNQYFLFQFYFSNMSCFQHFLLSNPCPSIYETTEVR